MKNEHPRYPIYIPSKGRAESALTAKLFREHGVSFNLVVEPQEEELYAEYKEHLVLLPDNNQGLIYSRNFIKDHAVASGAERHWQFDDDVRKLRRVYRGFRIPCDPNIAICVAEDFADRYENVALCSFNSSFFVPVTDGQGPSQPPFYLNHRCYTNFLMDNSLPNRWRYRYNEDTDMTLQVLAGGHCTILFNAFLMDTPATLTASGGQMAVYKDDGRLKMSRDLERVWPGVVTTSRRFRRPQHAVKHNWAKFDNKLIRKKDFKVPKGNNEYGMKLTSQGKVTDTKLQKLQKDYN